MMTTTTARHKLPLLVPGQAQKEMFHNEGLSMIDALLHAHVEGVGSNTPPASPAEGESWIVGPQPAGAWLGNVHAIASWTAGGWRFQRPVAGLEAIVADNGMRARWTGSAWVTGEMRVAKLLVDGRQVVGAQRPAIADPMSGTVVDSEARAALAAALGALRAHGLIG